jgi:predicted transcriptional regulator
MNTTNKGRTLTVRLDPETAAALDDREKAEPNLSAAEIIRTAINERSSLVYFVRRADGAVKIGHSASLRIRLATLKTEYGKLRLEAVLFGGREEESMLHEKHATSRLGSTEWFRGDSVEKEIASIVKENGVPDQNVPVGGLRPIVITIRLHKEEHRRFQKLARKKGVSLAMLVRLSVLNRDKP